MGWATCVTNDEMEDAVEEGIFRVGAGAIFSVSMGFIESFSTERDLDILAFYLFSFASLVPWEVKGFFFSWFLRLSSLFYS